MKIKTGSIDRLLIEDVSRRLTGWGRKVELKFFECVDSTNIRIAELAENGAGNMTVVLAARQTAGRGRVGRSFFSPENTGVYMSVLLEAESPEELRRFTPMAGVAVCHTLGEDAKIKWVNDVLLNGRKVCGILAETVALPDMSGKCSACVGIGVNVYVPEGGFPPEVQNKAGAVFQKRRAGGLADVAAGVINNLAELYCMKEDILEEYRERCIVPGKRITVCCGDSERNALAVGIDSDFGLIVRYGDGTAEHLEAGEVSVLGIY